MDKRGTAGIPCGICDEDAVPGTNPPRCVRHKFHGFVKQAKQDKPDTFKALEERTDERTKI